MNLETIARLGAEQHLVLTTYHRDGRRIETRVRAVTDGVAVYVLSGAASDEVDRLGGRPEVKLTPCGADGGPTGDAVDGRAVLLPLADVPRIERMVREKYGEVSFGVALLQRLRPKEQALIAIS